MGPPGHVFGFGTYGRVGSFFVLGTYGGWVATLENPFGTLEALETLGTLCVALCGDKVRTNFLLHLQEQKNDDVLLSSRSLLLLSPHVCVAVPLLPQSVWYETICEMHALSCERLPALRQARGDDDLGG